MSITNSIVNASNRITQNVDRMTNDIVGGLSDAYDDANSKLKEVGRAVTRHERRIENFVDKYVNRTIDSLYNLTDKRGYNKALELAGVLIGQSFDYASIAQAIESLGRDSESILGKQFPFIYYNMGMGVDKADEPNEIIPECNFFNFYGNVPTIRLTNPYGDSLRRHKWDKLFDFDGNATLHERLLNLSYAESEDGLQTNHEVTNQTTNGGSMVPNHESFNDFSAKSCDLIKKTNILFKQGELQTLIGRFHTNTFESTDQSNPTQTANTKAFGLSHGRNLLKLNITNENTYDNPYCRVWTYHHQYNTIKDLLRPFYNADTPMTNGVLDDVYGWSAFRTDGGLSYTREGYSDGKGGGGIMHLIQDNQTGGERLDRYGVLGQNGFVNIAPTAKIVDYFNIKTDQRNIVDPKRTMFSIENLAWKDFSGLGQRGEFDPDRLSAEQRGPFGGRIMWFPPYGLTFNENVSVAWNEHSFIGRGEKIYTYSNTDRGGNLSFQLLIDHPAILDYWTGRKAIPTNNGKPLIPGNKGGVDERDNQENTLLRFFAGCEVLSAAKQRYPYIKPPKPKPEKEPEPIVEPQQDPTPPPEPPVKKIVCMLYYPNNYSGKDDNGTQVNPIDYLMNGVYAQKQVVKEGDKLYTRDIPTSDTATFKDVSPNSQNNNQIVGGYEVRTIPISYNHITGNTTISINAMKQDGADTYKTEYAYIGSDGHGENIVAEYDASGEKTRYNIAKQPGPNAVFSASHTKKNKQVVPNDQWFFRKWFYRVDNSSNVTGDYAVSDQVLMADGDGGGRYDHYMDKVSHQLNAQGYLKTKEANPFGREEQTSDTSSGSTEETWISFADLYVAADEANHAKILDSLYTQDNVDLVKKVLKEEDGLKIKDVEFIGHASLHGVNKVESKNVGRNKTLATGRRDTFAKFVNDKFPATQGKTRKVDIKVEEGDKSLRTSTSVDDLTRKMWRSAEMVISYQEETTVDTEQVVTEKQTEQTSTQTTVGVKQIDDATENTNITSVQKSRIEGEVGVVSNPSEPDNGNTIEDEEEEGAVVTAIGYRDTTSTDVSWGDVNRYDNEGEFFQLLSDKDPVMHNLITDKIKYFDPAYHSISPEGFNSRLTFLHQCTRQGPTRSASDANGLTANNTSFGRPPVCVLRIGDFYYTKIIIKSLNITYDPLQWDLNQEGIGVMPMIAKIDISFQFIGGSDLAGPIARLQNALSFNYYANAGVYDNRADQVIYNHIGEPIKYKAYNPGYDAYTQDNLRNLQLIE